MISHNTRWNSQPTLACILPQPAVASRGWVAAHPRQPEHSKALALWFNSTMGLIIYWSLGCSTEHGRCRAPLGTIRLMPAPDLRELRPAQLQRLSDTYDEMAELPLMSASNAWRDPVRQRIDRAVLEILTDGIGAAGPSLAAARAMWCQEATVQGQKGKWAKHQQDMADLRDEIATAEQVISRPSVHIHEECLAALAAQYTTRAGTICPNCLTTIVRSGHQPPPAN